MRRIHDIYDVFSRQFALQLHQAKDQVVDINRIDALFDHVVPELHHSDAGQAALGCRQLDIVFSFGHCLSPPEHILQTAANEGKHATVKG